MIDVASLDDKTYQQIRDSAVSQIPALTELWTDHNPSDTGIMLLELLAAMLEQQNFYQSQVGERFFSPYLQLMNLDADGSSPREQFAQECAQIWVAVTPRDYEKLLLKSPFAIHWAQASAEDSMMVLKIFRKDGLLDEHALAALRAYLDNYRMIGVRLRVVQIDQISVDVVCRLQFDPTKGQESACRKQVKALLEAAAQIKRNGEMFNKGHFLTNLLAVAGVTGVEAITFLHQERELSDILWQTDLSVRLQSVRIELIDKKKGEHPA